MELIEPQNAIRNANNSKIMAQIAMEIFPRQAGRSVTPKVKQPQPW